MSPAHERVSGWAREFRLTLAHPYQVLRLDLASTHLTILCKSLDIRNKFLFLTRALCVPYLTLLKGLLMLRGRKLILHSKKEQTFPRRSAGLQRLSKAHSMIPRMVVVGARLRGWSKYLCDPQTTACNVRLLITRRSTLHWMTLAISDLQHCFTSFVLSESSHEFVEPIQS